MLPRTLAIKDGKLKFNPFSGVVPIWLGQSERRLPLDDADMKDVFIEIPETTR